MKKKQTQEKKKRKKENKKKKSTSRHVSDDTGRQHRQAESRSMLINPQSSSTARQCVILVTLHSVPTEVQLGLWLQGQNQTCPAHSTPHTHGGLEFIRSHLCSQQSLWVLSSVGLSSRWPPANHHLLQDVWTEHLASPCNALCRALLAHFSAEDAGVASSHGASAALSHPTLTVSLRSGRKHACLLFLLH